MDAKKVEKAQELCNARELRDASKKLFVSLTSKILRRLDTSAACAPKDRAEFMLKTEQLFEEARKASKQLRAHGKKYEMLRVSYYQGSHKD